MVFFFGLSCNKGTNSKNQFQESNLDWIIGNWKRTNDQKDRQTFENWIKKSNSEYIGFGFTLQSQDTVFKENLRIVQKEGHWYLEVKGVNEKPTPFIFLNKSDSSFISENKENEFPKKIKYSFSNNILTAIISDDENKIMFVFEKF
jgi:hypothetical protein